MRDIIIGILLGIIFSYLIITSIKLEDDLVDKYCSGLSGYEYGQCQAQIY